MNIYLVSMVNLQSAFPQIKILFFQYGNKLHNILTNYKNPLVFMDTLMFYMKQVGTTFDCRVSNNKICSL